MAGGPGGEGGEGGQGGQGGWGGQGQQPGGGHDGGNQWQTSQYQDWQPTHVQPPPAPVCEPTFVTKHVEVTKNVEVTKTFEITKTVEKEKPVTVTVTYTKEGEKLTVTNVVKDGNKATITESKTVSDREPHNPVNPGLPRTDFPSLDNGYCCCTMHISGYRPSWLLVWWWPTTAGGRTMALAHG